jgi:hypothetical protein
MTISGLVDHLWKVGGMQAKVPEPCTFKTSMIISSQHMSLEYFTAKTSCFGVLYTENVRLTPVANAVLTEVVEVRVVVMGVVEIGVAAGA